mgnify:FL=1
MAPLGGIRWLHNRSETLADAQEDIFGVDWIIFGTFFGTLFLARNSQYLMEICSAFGSKTSILQAFGDKLVPKELHWTTVLR